MGLDGHRARQRWVGLGTVCIFLNPAAKILMQDVGICTLYLVFDNFHPYIFLPFLNIFVIWFLSIYFLLINNRL